DADYQFSPRGLSGGRVDQACDRLEGELVALRPKPENAAGGGEADIGMMPEALAPEDVGQMHLDNRQVGGLERVVHRDRGVRQSAGVENDPIRSLARLLDPVDELALVIGLAEIDGEVERRGPRDAALLDIGQRIVAVSRRFPHAEQVEVRAVKYKDGRQGRPPVRKSPSL